MKLPNAFDLWLKTYVYPLSLEGRIPSPAELNSINQCNVAGWSLNYLAGAGAMTIYFDYGSTAKELKYM